MLSAPPTDLLAPLFAPLTSLRGIGPAVAALIAQGRGRRSGDRSAVPSARILPRPQRPADDPGRRPGTVATLAVEVVRHERPANSRQPWRIIVRDDTGSAELVFFRFTREAQTPPGTRLLVSGKLDAFNGRLTLAHPDHMVPADQPERIPVVEPVWPLTAGLWPRQVARAWRRRWRCCPTLPEWHDAALLKRERWPSFARRAAHRAGARRSSPRSAPARAAGLRRVARRPGRARPDPRPGPSAPGPAADRRIGVAR